MPSPSLSIGPGRRHRAAGARERVHVRAAVGAVGRPSPSRSASQRVPGTVAVGVELVRVGCRGAVVGAVRSLRRCRYRVARVAGAVVVQVGLSSLFVAGQLSNMSGWVSPSLLSATPGQPSTFGDACWYGQRSRRQSTPSPSESSAGAPFARVADAVGRYPPGPVWHDPGSCPAQSSVPSRSPSSVDRVAERDGVARRRSRIDRRRDAGLLSPVSRIVPSSASRDRAPDSRPAAARPRPPRAARPSTFRPTMHA